jgi:GT2 family glycosyltransferase
MTNSATVVQDTPLDRMPEDVRIRAEVDVVIPTFRRSSRLVETIRSLEPTANLLRSVFVIDNGQSAETRDDCRDLAAKTGLPVVYIDPGGNIGPAGATARAMQLALDALGEDHWVLRLDDDRPIPPGLLPLLLDEAIVALDEDPRTAAVGLDGAVWKPRRARLVEPRRTGDRFVAVDYLKTNHFPLFHTGAIRATGGFRADLFFGMTEVEYGIRTRRAGFTLKEAARLRHYVKPNDAPRRRFVRRSDWRRYYSLRNLLIILRDSGQPFTAVRVGVSRGLLRPLLDLVLDPREGARNLRLSTRALADASRGRMGKRIDPYQWARNNRRLDATGDMPRT